MSDLPGGTRDQLKVKGTHITGTQINGTHKLGPIKREPIAGTHKAGTANVRPAWWDQRPVTGKGNP